MANTYAMVAYAIDDASQIKQELDTIMSYILFSSSELCRGKAMVAYTKTQQRKKEESERLRGEIDHIKFIDLRFTRWQVVRFRKARGRQDVPYIAVTWHSFHHFFQQMAQISKKHLTLLMGYSKHLWIHLKDKTLTVSRLY